MVVGKSDLGRQIEISKADDGAKATVQFIHELVRTFLVKEKGLSVIDSSLDQLPLGTGHSLLKEVCLDYIKTTELYDQVEDMGGSRETAPHHAAKNGHDAVVETLITYRADTEAEMDLGEWIIRLAAKGGNQ